MKKVVLVLIAFLTTAGFTFSQNSEVDKLFVKYSEQDGYKSVLITPYMFNLISKIETSEEDKDFQDVIKGLNSIKILSVGNEQGEKVKAASFYQSCQQALPSSIYKDLMVIKEKDETVKFLINEKDNKIRELVMLINSNDEAVLIYLDGIIDLDKVSKLSKSMNVSGFKHLEKVHEKER
ncbi:MAG: DUF4252 domain-containing protein [Bacteroidia bacterium]|nr:DUF4252 domain-containing protein [Bacteroidia bacterium]